MGTSSVLSLTYSEFIGIFKFRKTGMPHLFLNKSFIPKWIFVRSWFDISGITQLWAIYLIVGLIYIHIFYWSENNAALSKEQTKERYFKDIGGFPPANIMKEVKDYNGEKPKWLNDV